MIPLRWGFALAFFSLVLASAPTSLPAASGFSEPVSRATDQIARPNRLKVMTFNVKGLPFPIALGRSFALRRIAERFAQLRRQGRQPQVVALQEAFTPDAKAIAALAGYRYVAIGPQPGDLAQAPADTAAKTFREKADWVKGETEGKWLDSGLVILSDYPILKTRRLPFPANACAGYDCLATKGVLIAWIKVPGLNQSVAIADTHLNSRGATGVDVRRADQAYVRQVRTAASFVSEMVDDNTALIFTGDFNVGHVPRRINAAARFEGRELVSEMADAEATPELEAIAEHAKDKQFFRSGGDVKIAPISLIVPFGKTHGAEDLSDHVGFYGTYSLAE